MDAKSSKDPISVLFGKADMRCTGCGKPSKGDHSRCFVTLKCTKCGDTKRDLRIPAYGDLDVVECLCPECVDTEENR